MNDKRERFKTVLEEQAEDELEATGEDSPQGSARDPVLLELSAIADIDEGLADHFVEKPSMARHDLERALEDLGYDAPVHVTDNNSYIETIDVSDLGEDHVGELVAVHGQLTKVTQIGIRIETGTFNCQRCGCPVDIPQPQHMLQEPHECSGGGDDGCDGSHFRLDEAASEFVDQRHAKIETPPDIASQGERAEQNVVIKGDLCHYGGPNGTADRAGEKCTLIGEYKIDRRSITGKNATPETEMWFDTEAIIFHDNDNDTVDIEAHRETIEEAMAREDPVAYCRENIAPALEIDEDLETVFEAAVAWMFGAYRVDQDDATYRGDIHFGLIGDPGTGKSTLLSELHKICPISEFRSGTGLTKVGLTAAAIHEEFAGKSQWTLEPGILPRSNGGHCIIDEVDDVLDGDTKAVHDALEGEQMVKIDKANISADLETRTSLLASGNPVKGRFDPYEPVAEQVDLDPALIDRMDILLDLQDVVDEETDTAKANHYLDSYDEVSRHQLYERGELSIEPDMNTASRDISVEAMRAWVAYARENVFPRLTEEAKDALREFYVDARNLNGGHDAENNDEAIPVTPRTLGAGVRVATAFARCEGSETVEERHVERAKRIAQKTIGLNFDPVTGQFDAGKTDTGHMQRDELVRHIVADCAEDTQQGAPMEEAVEAVTSQTGISRGKAEKEIEKLKNRGDLYEPATGYLRPT